MGLNNLNENFAFGDSCFENDKSLQKHECVCCASLKDTQTCFIQGIVLWILVSEKTQGKEETVAVLGN